MDSPKNLEKITWTYVAIPAGRHSGLVLHRKAIGITEPDNTQLGVRK